MIDSILMFGAIACLAVWLLALFLLRVVADAQDEALRRDPSIRSSRRNEPPEPSFFAGFAWACVVSLRLVALFGLLVAVILACAAVSR